MTLEIKKTAREKIAGIGECVSNIFVIPRLIANAMLKIINVIKISFKMVFVFITTSPFYKVYHALRLRIGKDKKVNCLFRQFTFYIFFIKPCFHSQSI